jgi:hypothetical protein
MAIFLSVASYHLHANYPLIIAVAVAALVVSLLVIIPPSRMQDRPGA